MDFKTSDLFIILFLFYFDRFQKNLNLGVDFGEINVSFDAPDESGNWIYTVNHFLNDHRMIFRK
jgi:hypothetical protein